MAIALEAIDLTAICAILLLIGCLIAIEFVLEFVADVLDVTIPVIHVRPFHGAAVALRHSIIRGVNGGIDKLQHVAADLWHYSAVALTETVNGTLDFVHAVERSLHWIERTHVWKVAHAIADPIAADLAAVKRTAERAAADVAAETLARERAIGRETRTVEAWARSQLADLQSAILGKPLHRFPQLERDVSQAIDAAVTSAEKSGAAVAGTLTGAAEAALTAAEQAGTLTAGELRDLLNGLNPADVAALLAAVPLLRAALAALEAETGLDNAACRGKVKGVCGTNASQWAHLLEGLAFTLAWPGLEAFLTGVGEQAQEILAEASDLLGLA